MCYLSVITCLDSQLAGEPGSAINPFIDWVAQSAYVSVSTPSNSPCSSFCNWGFLGARWKQPLAPSLPADVRPSCCPQGTRKDRILRPPAGETTATKGQQRWDLNSGQGKQRCYSRCYKTNNPASTPARFVWENIQNPTAGSSSLKSAPLRQQLLHYSWDKGVQPAKLL